jgi:hypothetical protein
VPAGSRAPTDALFARMPCGSPSPPSEAVYTRSQADARPPWAAIFQQLAGEEDDHLTGSRTLPGAAPAAQGSRGALAFLFFKGAANGLFGLAWRN